MKIALSQKNGSIEDVSKNKEMLKVQMEIVEDQCNASSKTQKQEIKS